MTNLSLELAHQSLLGISYGDAFGQQYFYHAASRDELTHKRQLPASPWYVTDDTIMSCSIVRSLQRHQGINQDFLASDFAILYSQNSDRGYGGTAHRILRHIQDGTHWSHASAEVFDGMGSKGNGAAMRAAPIGAYFHHDFTQVIAQAKASAEVTHAHQEAQDGAVAVALASALICRNAPHENPTLIKQICGHLPPGHLLATLEKADRLPRRYSLQTATSVLGNGTKLLASDTVPLVLWALTRHLGSWDDLMWTLFECGGDVDTTCAIAAGIAILQEGVKPPQEWRDATERLDQFLSL